MREQD